MLTEVFSQNHIIKSLKYVKKESKEEDSIGKPIKYDKYKTYNTLVKKHGL
jgi:hypothetical protein